MIDGIGASVAGRIASFLSVENTRSKILLKRFLYCFAYLSGEISVLKNCISNISNIE